MSGGGVGGASSREFELQNVVTNKSRPEQLPKEYMYGTDNRDVPAGAGVMHGMHRVPSLNRFSSPINIGGGTNNHFLQESYELTRHAKSTVQWYIILKTFMSGLLAAMIGIVLFLVDVDFWFVFTVMAFLLNYIPTVGGAISIIAPLVITVLDPTKSLTDILIVFTLPGLSHILCGNVIEPHLFGSAFDLHPIVVMFCLVVWSSLWGVTGAVLSVPLTCCLKLALKPNVTRHPYAMFLYHLMEFRLPDEETLEIFLETPSQTPTV